MGCCWLSLAAATTRRVHSATKGFSPPPPPPRISFGAGEVRPPILWQPNGAAVKRRRIVHCYAGRRRCKPSAEQTKANQQVDAATRSPRAITMGCRHVVNGRDIGSALRGNFAAKIGQRYWTGAAGRRPARNRPPPPPHLTAPECLPEVSPAGRAGERASERKLGASQWRPLDEAIDAGEQPKR